MAADRAHHSCLFWVIVKRSCTGWPVHSLMFVSQLWPWRLLQCLDLAASPIQSEFGVSVWVWEFLHFQFHQVRSLPCQRLGTSLSCLCWMWSISAAGYGRFDYRPIHQVSAMWQLLISCGNVRCYLRWVSASAQILGVWQGDHRVSEVRTIDFCLFCTFLTCLLCHSI